ncbi:formyltransferase family protein [Salegentibacter sp. Hel_I_6]|uniref:formyltransferase family protein n=1 Tax=Salegentibacter sp. Hel_I_6 TaxID=1250278 RepID=UPI00056CCD8B|nr:formyltransferase family protein [Salegentibacter sp. Hel_I_6]
MKLAILGNNDGPLRLIKSLKKQGLKPVCVGLQKVISDELYREYTQYISETEIFTDFKEEKALKYLESFKIDLLINCFCNFKFIKLLEIYKILNIHLSELPKYRGRHPLHWALINGEEYLGVSIHKMTPKFDGGDIYWQYLLKTKEGMSVKEAREELLQQLEKEFGAFIKNLEQNKVEIKSNPDKEATYISRRFPEDSQLTEWYDIDLIFRKVMALSSESNPAYILKNGKKINIVNAEKITSSLKGKPGKIVNLFDDGIEICGKNQNIILKSFAPSKFNFKINNQL